MVLIACSAVFFGVVFDLFFRINDDVLSQHNHQHIHENAIYIFLQSFLDSLWQMPTTLN